MTTLSVGPPWRVDGPPPIKPTYGLLQAAEAPAAGVRFVEDLDDQGRERWLDGIAVYPYLPGLASVWNACAVGSMRREKSFGDDFENPEFVALVANIGETCTSSRIWDQAAFMARASTVLAAVEGSAIAGEFMSGDVISGQPYLSDGEGTFPNNDTPTSPINGIALLEGEIAKSGRNGLIHCSPMLATHLMGYGFALADKTGVIRTINGIVVIPDFGYVLGASTPLHHADPVDLQEWAYATGPIDIRRTGIIMLPGTVEEALDRGTGGATTGRPNSITYRAERYYALDWDTAVQAAVLIDRCQLTC